MSRSAPGRTHQPGDAAGSAASGHHTGNPQPTRFLFFYDAVVPDYVGGIEERNHLLALALADKGHHVTLAGRARVEHVFGPSVQVRQIGPVKSLANRRTGKRSTWRALGLAWKALRIDLTGVDVVETANIPLLHLFPLAVRCKRAHIPMVVTWHEFWGSFWRDYSPSRLGVLSSWRLRSWIERRAARLGDRCVAVSGLTAERVASVRGEPVEVVANGVDIERIRSVEPVEGHDTGHLVFAGRLIEDKRIELLVRAAAELSDHLPGRLATIIGDGPRRATLENLVEQLGLTGRIEFLGWLDTPAEVWAMMRGAKVAVLPSRREGFSLFALEAMALGLPVIYCASSESAVADLVRHGQEGLEVAPDPELVCRTVTDLLDDLERYDTMSINARRRAEQFDWCIAADAFERIADEVVHSVSA